MDNVKSRNVLMVVLVSLVVSLGVVYFMKPYILPPYAGAPGPDRFFPCESSEGITKCFKKVGLSQSTTTVCAMQSPNATSTLVRGGMSITNLSSSTGYILGMVRSDNTGTSTGSVSGSGTVKMATTSIAANALGVLNAFATSSRTDNGTNFFQEWLTDKTFEPGEYLVGYIQGGGGTFSPTGICQATWEVINR